MRDGGVQTVNDGKRECVEKDVGGGGGEGGRRHTGKQTTGPQTQNMEGWEGRGKQQDNWMTNTNRHRKSEEDTKA